MSDNTSREMIEIHPEAILDAFANEPNHVFGTFMKQIGAFDVDRIDETIARIWLEGYYSGKNSSDG